MKISRKILQTCFFVILAHANLHAAPESSKPNIIVILTDDQGYGDLGCFGAKNIATPNIDRLCSEGMKFTSFYVTNRCSPTRLAFMTGSLPERAGWSKVIYRHSLVGIHPDEVTVPELMKKAGYTTGIVGKWHLGEFQKFNPVRHGFDSFYGFLQCGGVEGKDEGLKGLFSNTEFLEKSAGKTHGQYSPKLRQEGIDFIRKNKDRPFFLYYSSPLPHVKWIPNEKFKGSSRQGTYGDVIQEIDWQVGGLMDTLDELGLTKNTLVIFASDNGPQLNVKGHGSSGPLRDGKWTNFEGGIRSPTIMRWPAVISAGSINNEITSIMDLLPTFCELAGVETPDDRVLDGRSILPYLEGKKLPVPIHDTFIVPGATIRHGDWKLLLKAQKPGGSKANKVGKTDRVHAAAGSLFNLTEDIGETTDLSRQHPERVAELTKRMKAFQAELIKNTRPIGRINEVPNDLKKQQEKSKKKK
ncbi:MAG: sulfatase-like hydrolase/transferase [Verrucomicrobiae bacterium]|nr:sulfatase-like hydrolase/transferase [Verrucomicrobiae bacterium]